MRPNLFPRFGENYAARRGRLRSGDSAQPQSLAQAEHCIGLVFVQRFRSGQDARKSLCTPFAGQHLKPHLAIDTACLLVVAVAAPNLCAINPAWVFLAHELQKLAQCETVEADGVVSLLGHDSSRA